MLKLLKGVIFLVWIPGGKIVDVLGIAVSLVFLRFRGRDYRSSGMLSVTFLLQFAIVGLNSKCLFFIISKGPDDRDSWGLCRRRSSRGCGR